MEEQRMKNPKINKRNKLPLLLGILLLISAAAYGTRAYFTDSATEQAGIELMLGNLKIESKSTGWEYNNLGQAKPEIQGEGKVLYTNVSGGDSFTKNFIFENTGSLKAVIKLREQDVVKQPDANHLSTDGKVYSYAEGPYDIKITSNNRKFMDLVAGIEIVPDDTIDIKMEISLNPELDNTYNKNGKNGNDLDTIALGLLGKNVTVELTELSKK